MKQKNLFLMCLLAFLPLVANADAVKINGIYYNLNADNHTAEVTSNPSKYSGDVVIPSTVSYENSDYSVTSIGDSAFDYCENLTGVIIPSSVTSIGWGAFSNCSSLKEIVLPEGLTAIEDCTFGWCFSLTKLNIPSTVTRLGNNPSEAGDGPFMECRALKTITIPESVQIFGQNSLAISLGTIIIMESSTPPAINSNVITDGTLVLFSNIIVPDNSKSAYQTASVWNRDIIKDKIIEKREAGGILTKEVTIDQVRYKLNYENYTAEVISKTDKYSGAVVIPASVMYDQVSYTVNGIGDQAFYQCTGLTELTIPASITYIGRTTGSSEVFRGCNENSFKKVHISDLEAWCRITFADDYYANPLGVAHHLYLNDSEITDLVIPSTITTLGVFQFAGCYGINSVSIPESVVNFSAAVFFDCKNIQSVNIPSGVTSIGVNMFNGCTQLTSVDIPNNITIISSGAFKRTGLTSIRIPSTVTSIGDEAFCSCTNLNSVTVNKNTPLAITEYTFTNNANATLYVPAGSASSYSAANYWKDFDNIEEISQDYTDNQGVRYTLNSSTNTYTVSGYTDACTGEIKIPATMNGCSVTSIVNGAFSGCSNLTSISIPNSVNSIGNRAFLNCTELTSISIPSGVTRIEELTFRGCSNLISIDLPATIQFIDEQAFYECSSLESIIVPNGAVVGKDGIVNTTFSGCTNLRRIEIGDNVRLYQCLFYSMPSLTEVVYGKSVQTSSEAFKKTYPSATLYVPEDRFDYYSNNSPYNTIFGTIQAKTQEYTDGQGVKYTLNDDGQTYKVSGHINPFTGDITIPATVNGCSVTSIGNDAFSCSGLTSVVIPEGVTSIGESAFINCPSMTSATIPTSVTSIGGWAFCNTGISSLTIPASVASIGECAFGACHALASIQVENGNTTYDSRNGCNAIIEKSSNALKTGCKETIIPSTVTSISDWAFYGCSGLTSVTIPNRVTSIGERAFYYCSGLTSVTIPNSVTLIRERAFQACSGLTSMVVENGNAKYDSRDNCNALIETATNTLISGCKNSIIPGSVISIGEGAFQECSGLTSVTIPNSVTFIDNYAFPSCSDLTSVTIPNSVTLIGQSAFDNSNLTDVYCYAESVPTTYASPFSDTNIGNATLHVPAGRIEAYKAAEPWSGFNSIVAIADETPAQEYTDAQGVKYALNTDGHTYTVSGHTESYTQDIIIPAKVNGCSVTSIGNSAFSGCSGLTSVTIPNSVTYIDALAFDGCTGLTSVHISDMAAWCNISFYPDSNPLGYAHHLYLNGEEITELVIPNSVSHINCWAFWYCTGLTSVIIPNSVTDIDGWAFDGCSGLTSIVVESGNSVYDSRDNCNAIIETQSNKLIVGCKNTIIPNSVTSIGVDAFFGCSDMTSVTIPNSVTSIEASAFNRCSGLTSVTIPNSVTSIDFYAFYGCTSLTSVTIGNSVISIDRWAFEGCSGLTDVYCHVETVPTTASDAFVNSNITSATLHVPAGCIDKYKSVAPWSGFNSIVAIADETPAQEYTDTQGVKYTLNGDGQTYTVSDLDDAYTGEIIIPAIVNGCSVTSIGYNAFSYCRNMTSVTIPNSVTSIGQWAFWGCSSLTSITIPKSVTYIGEYLFHGCSNLTTIIVEAENPVYDSREDCNAIIETTTNKLIAGCNGTVIPNSITSFSSGAFYGIDGLTSLVISKNVTSIEGCSFASSGLTSITVEAGNPVYDSRNNCNAIIETATNKLIAGCKNTSIPNNVTSIGYAAFYRSHDLTSVTIPSGVTSIGDWAFGECGSLTSLAIPNGVTSIGSYAFCYCGGITSLSLPNSLTSLGDRAFAECRGLTDVYCFAVNVPATDANAFLDSNIGNATLYVPEGCKATYEAADYWKDFKNIVELVLPKAESGLIYSGTAQNLISASSITTMQYSLDGTTYSTTIPQGTDAKEYTIYYKEDNLGIANSIKVTIAPKTVSSPTISLSETTCSYDGKAQEPTVTVKDGSSTIPSAEYTVSYTNNTEVGTATVTITDKEGGNYIVSGSTSFTICRAIKDIFKGSDLWAGYVAQEDLAVPTGLTAYVITSLGNSTATASQITYIPQGVPVLLKRDNTDVNSFEASPGTGTSPTTNLLKAYTTDKTVANREGYVLFKDEFVLVSAGTLPAGKVFLPANSSSKSSTRSIIIDGGDTTDIDGMRVDPDQMDEKWYDLQGRRLDKKPKKKGLYILNGRKVIVK